MSEGGLFAPVVSITRTQRRRFFWVAWWSAAPSAEPFRKPDGASGGARTRAEAKRAAESAAGRELVEIGGEWARAWVRAVAGKPPWPRQRDPRASAPKSSAAEHRPSAWATLGVDPHAPLEAIKLAFRKRALETHPDRGGDARSFDALKRAYDHALALHEKRSRRSWTKR